MRNRVKNVPEAILVVKRVKELPIEDAQRYMTEFIIRNMTNAAKVGALLSPGDVSNTSIDDVMNIIVKETGIKVPYVRRKNKYICVSY
jgi:hypothetical protein